MPRFYSLYPLVNLTEHGVVAYTTFDLNDVAGIVLPGRRSDPTVAILAI